MIVTRNKAKRLKIWWAPCATSTPVKIVPDNENIHCNLERQFHAEPLQCINKLEKKCGVPDSLLRKCIESKLLLSRTTKTPKSSDFCEISSSSDEDNETVRPIIKLRSTKKTSSLFLNKNIPSDVVKESCENKNVGNFKKNDATGVNIDPKASILNSKSDTKVIKITSSTESILITDEQTNIFDKIKPTRPLNLRLEKKNKLNHSQSNETFTHLNNCVQAKKKKLRNVHKINHTSVKSNLRGANCVPEGTKKAIEKDSFENDNLCKPLKRKNKSAVNETDPVKKRKPRKISKVAEPEEKPVTFVVKLKNELNKSHQLFSDSRVQEFMNTLDLTSSSAEDNEAKEKKCSQSQDGKRSFYASYYSPHPSIQEVTSNAKVSQKTLRKPKQNPTKTSMKKPSKKPSLNSEGKKQTKSDENLTENINLTKKENSLKEKVNMTCTEKETLTPATSVVNTSNNVSNSKSAVSCCDKNVKSVKLSTIAKSKRKHPTENSGFKLFKELSHKKKNTGCSVLECWSLKTFRCGIFKLKIKSQMNCHTLYCNSYLGGVLIKGNLKMKIGEKEQELTEGDMAFVPPLTEWQATNTGDCESSFYYWCGRFNS